MAYESVALDATAAGGVFAMLAAFAGIAIIIFLAVYIYMALAWMTIAKKLKHDKPWLAWIPIANMYLIMDLAKAPLWSFIVVLVSLFLSAIPVIGLLFSIAMIAITIWWTWKVYEKRSYPGALSLLNFIPVVNFIMIGIVAWVDRK